MAWAATADGIYHPEYTYRGLAAASGAVAHFIMMQYDGQAKGKCQFFGHQGMGHVTALGPWAFILNIIVGTAMGFAGIQVIYAFMVLKLDERTERALRPLRSPLRFAYDMHKIGFSEYDKVERGTPLSDDPNWVYDERLQDIQVTYGEEKSSLGNTYGKLILGPAERMIRLRRKRCYSLAAAKAAGEIDAVDKELMDSEVSKFQVDEEGDENAQYE